MIGPSEFSFFVSSAMSPEVDLIVRTFDVGPDGSETEVTVGAMRVTGLAPGEIRRITFRDYGDNWVFRAGHSLRVRVANIDFPSFRPPGVNDNLLSDITIYNGKRYPSRVTMAVRAN
jgi:predicted acyl esterase